MQLFWIFFKNQCKNLFGELCLDNLSTKAVLGLLYHLPMCIICNCLLIDSDWIIREKMHRQGVRVVRYYWDVIHQMFRCSALSLRLFVFRTHIEKTVFNLSNLFWFQMSKVMSTNKKENNRINKSWTTATC